MNNMYKIHMNTPMGTLNGLLRMNITGKNVNGVINVNGQSFEFKNGTYSNNKFHFNGSLRLFLKKVSYTADGEINGKNITILVITNTGNFKIEGERA